MNDVNNILDELTSLSIEARVDRASGRLFVNPVNKVPDGLRQRLRQAKTLVIDALISGADLEDVLRRQEWLTLSLKLASAGRGVFAVQSPWQRECFYLKRRNEWRSMERKQRKLHGWLDCIRGAIGCPEDKEPCTVCRVGPRMWRQLYDAGNK